MCCNGQKYWMPDIFLDKIVWMGQVCIFHVISLWHPTFIVRCHFLSYHSKCQKKPWLDQTILNSLGPFCQHTLINSKCMYVLETYYRTHLFGLLSLIHFKSSTMIYSFIYRTLTCLIHIGNDVPFLVLPISCWERVHHSSVLVTHVLLNVFTPCWGICVTNRNRTVL